MTSKSQYRHSFRRTWPERFTLLLMFSLVGIGVAGSYVDKTWFEQVYTVEDGLIEWLTVVPLLVVASVFLFRLATRRSTTSGKELTMQVLVTMVCIFAAGEEISWGQRIFQVESPAFFTEHNAQKETNLHNMIVGGVKVNKLIFSQLFTILAAFYLLVFPWLYRTKLKLRALADAWTVPVPQPYQVIAIVLLAVLIGLCRSGKNAELLELGATTIFALIMLYPLPKHKGALATKVMTSITQKEEVKNNPPVKAHLPH